MSKSTSATRARWALAGLTTGAVGAALLVAPQAALAAISVGPSLVPVGGTVTITDDVTSSGTPFTGGNASKVQLLLGATACSGTYTAQSASVLVPASNTSTTTVVTFPVPNTASPNANGQARRYTACVYAGNTAGTSALQGLAAGYPVYVGVPPTASPAVGPSGGGNTVTISGGPSGAIFTGVTSVSAGFTSESCPATYAGLAAGTGIPATKLSDNSASVNVPNSLANTTPNPTPYNICVFNGSTAASTLISVANYGVSLLRLSQTTGPFGGGNGINVTAPTEYLAGIDAPGVVFTAAACPGTYTETGDSAVKPVATENVRKLSNGRMAVTAPEFYANRTAFITAASSGTAVWNLCVYGGQTVSSSALSYSTPYTITTVASAAKITPSAGPALGGRRITVTGDAFPSAPGALTATLGGAPLLDIQVINANAFTAITPMRAPANKVALVLATAAGSSTLANAYSFTSTLAATPNTAPNTRPIDVIVNGVGFQSPNWSSNQSGAHIYLVDGKYESSATGGSRANPGEAECVNVLPLSDTELVCTLNLNKRLNAAGTASFNTPVSRAVTLETFLGSRVVTISSGTVSKLDIGMAITGHTNLPDGTTIVDVIDSGKAVVSADPTAGFSDTSTNIAAPGIRSAVAVTGMVASTKRVTAAAGTFTPADKGHRIAGGNIVADSFITAVAPDGSYVTVTDVSADSSGAGTVTTSAGFLPVPEGAYNLTYVSNGSNGASISDGEYVQSVVSSASTFTVSSF